MRDTQVRQIVADVLNLDSRSVDLSTARENTTAWDSLNQINLIIALEEEFQVSFEVEEIEQMVSVRTILDVLRRKLQPR